MKARLRLRAAASGAAALLLLAFAAWAGGALRPASGHLRAPAQPTYPRGSGRAEIPIGDTLLASGQPLQLSAFSTRDPPARVIGFYADAFRSRGLVPLSAMGGKVGHVSAFDFRDGLQRFVTALAEAGGETFVLSGAADPRRLPKLLATARAAPYPVPQESRGFLGYSSEDAGSRADAGQFVTALSPRGVRSFYRSKLAEHGYEEGDRADGEALLTFVRPTGETVAVAIQALAEDRGAAVFVARMQPR